MNIRLKYGKKELEFDIEKKNVIRLLELSPVRKINSIRDRIRNSLRHPIGTLPLRELVRKTNPRNVVILLEDITRSNPDYAVLLSELVSELNLAGVNKPKFVIAYGAHRKHTDDETERLYGKEILNYEIIHHDCDDEQRLVSAGKLSTGNELIVNDTVAKSDFVITTGNIEPHPFAGYTGGRKAILPGISGRTTITANHAKVVRIRKGSEELENNPIHNEMSEAANMIKIKFIINIIRNDKNEIVKIVSGDLKEAFYEGVRFAKEIFTVKVKRLADVAIVSCGGYPKDINLYQAQRSVTATSKVVKKNGTIVVVACCEDGIGQPIFEKWLKQYSIREILDKKENEIEVEGHRAYLTAKILNNCEVIIISSLSREMIENLKFSWIKKINDAIRYVTEKHGNNFKAYIILNGSKIVPTVY